MANQRFIVVAFLLIALVVGLAVHSATLSIIPMQGWQDVMIGGVFATSSVVGIASGALSFFVLLKTPAAVLYADEAIGELVKVTWPTREQTVNSALVVVATAFVLAGSLAVFDFVWARLTNLFLFNVG